jgi:hypothetical protein
MQPAIYGLAGLELTDSERDFFRDADPAGFILFKRNCETREQVRRLTDSLRELSGRPDVPILIDQEGGRVARMKPPEWPAFPAAERFAALYQVAPSSAIEAVRANTRAVALMLREVGVNVDALPLLDVRQEGASDIIGDRALGSDPMQVAALGRAVLDGLASAGVVGIVKHIPGHGRALVDSHKELPVVTASEQELDVDLEPFERLSGAPMGMMAHVVYTVWDAERPASMSPTTAPRQWPMCSGPVGLAETYSTLTRSSLPTVHSPYSSPSRRIVRSSSRQASGDRRRLMKPGPAISTEVTGGSASSFALISSASARGLVAAGFASTIAALVARSPCAGSRGGSTVTFLRSRSAGSAPSATRSSSTPSRSAAYWA